MSRKHNSATRVDSMIARLSRRGFLKSSIAAAGAAGVGIGFSPQAQAADPTKTLVYLFLRGGNDGLSLVVPISGTDHDHYMSARNQTRLSPTATNVTDRPIPLTGNVWGLHPFATGLKQLWDLDKLAIVHAVGHLDPETYTRSHFDAQEQIELGTPGVQSSQNGWLTRHLMSIPAVNGAVFTAMVSGQNPPISLNGWSDVATLDSTGGFHPNPWGTFRNTHLRSLRTMYAAGNGELDLAARAAADAVDLIDSLDLDNYVPGGGVTYPDTGLGRDLQLVAQLMRQNLGISVATVDYGGWDTHNRQAVLGGYGNRVRELSDALSAFYRDLAGAGRANDVAVIVQTEFGRQVTENADFGTDHGLANPMFVIGGGVNGGFYGTFPGLAPAQREGDAVVPTTDFRQVQATVLAQLMGSPDVEAVFDDAQAPPFTYQRMGFA